MNEEDMVFSHTARISVAPTQRQVELTALLKERDSLDDSSLESHPLFFFRAEISNDLLDSHFTHMSEKTLQNYAEDATKGVAFLRGHNWRELPLGYSLSGNYEEVGKKRVVSDFYTVHGMSDTDDLIIRMKTGLVRDVSVGFHGGRMICDLCGSDFWDCRHWPGLKYETKEGDVVKIELATYTIEDARLSEVSGVFDGSTPEAMILKAQRAAKAGELTKEQVGILENKYRVALPATTFHKVAPVRKVKTMTEEEIVKVRTILKVASEEEIIPGVETLQRRLSELEPQAEEGRQYRTDLIEEALTEGVRAQGNDFDRATYEATLKSVPLAVIKRMKADWTKIAEKNFTSGRSSVDDEQVPKPKVAPNLIPDAAYQ